MYQAMAISICCLSAPEHCECCFFSSLIARIFPDIFVPKAYEGQYLQSLGTRRNIQIFDFNLMTLVHLEIETTKQLGAFPYFGALKVQLNTKQSHPSEPPPQPTHQVTS
jgi:hypothetical protein